MNRVVLIGYGNPTRADDGVGWHVADQLRADPRFEGAAVLAVHQLTPELADDLAIAEAVVFIDASTGPPGEVRVEPLEPNDAGAWTHQLDPGALLHLTAQLHGRTPAAAVVTVGGASFDAGTELSPAVRAAVPAAVEALAVVIGAVSALHPRRS